MTTILVLGAEKHGATSLACAYPNHTVIFASDRDILDGSDLHNVGMVLTTPENAAELAVAADQVVPLCPRWMPQGHALTVILERLRRAIPDYVLPVRSEAPSSGYWIAKGDRWTRPDAPISGQWDQLADVTDPYGCGLVYQQYCRVKSTAMAIGRRDRSGALVIGIVEVFQERFFRDVVLQAGETIDAPDILDRSVQAIEGIDHRGFFTLNWLRTDEGLKLSSLRPVPRAIFQTFLRGGVDLLGSVSSTKVVAAGLRFVADPTYVSFERTSR